MEKRFKKIIALFIVVAGSALALPVFSQDIATEKLEPVFGYIMNGQGVTFQVPSGGCTNKLSFAIRQVEGATGANKEIGLFRTTPDECLAYIPMGIPLEFSFTEMGLQAGDLVHIINPLQPSRALPLN